MICGPKLAMTCPGLAEHQDAVRSADIRKRRVYRDLADGWLRCVDQFVDAHYLTARTARWQTPNLTVRVTPHLVLEHADERIEAVRLYVKEEPLIEFGQQPINAMLWVMEHAGRQLHPGGVTPAVVDIRRGLVYRPVPQQDGFAAWIHSEAAAYYAMWSMLAA
jgi:hypothetical protein